MVLLININFFNFYSFLDDKAIMIMANGAVTAQGNPNNNNVSENAG